MNNTTEIICVLDRSGSMSSIKAASIEGFNTFLQDQKEEEGEAFISVHLFDDQFETLQERVAIKDAQELNEGNFVPRGMTALYDAVCKTINETNGAHALLAEDERPSKVLFIILTDGDENSSREYSSENLKQLVQEQTDKGWAFVYLAANQDAVETAQSMNISASNAMNFSASDSSSKALYSSLSNKTKMYRSMSSVQARSASLNLFDADEQDVRDDIDKK